MVSGIFTLREDSPLPSWFVLPKELRRDQVAVTITEYESTTSNVWKVRVTVRRKHHWIFGVIQEHWGTVDWHPDSSRERTPAAEYPNWVVIKIGGTKEVYEQSEANNLLKIVKKPLY
ncbi:MAG TPA: hypothetical protein VFC44_25210 [Candidatus Saccharimonadales bacterium]|nr:hypothetical protein [Candidatus Saccharimonadales bacterium]